MSAAPSVQFLPWLFPKLLGVVYCLAFSSLLVQVPGLYGSRGILPIRDYLTLLRQGLGRRAYRVCPTLRQAAPHQPRLDWQMWFAALDPRNIEPWLGGLVMRLLEGSPPVLALFERNPFPDGPPRFIRLTVYRYRFADLATRRTEGRWWERTLIGRFQPLALSDGDGRPGEPERGRGTVPLPEPISGLFCWQGSQAGACLIDVRWGDEVG